MLILVGAWGGAVIETSRPILYAGVVFLIVFSNLIMLQYKLQNYGMGNLKLVQIIRMWII